MNSEWSIKKVSEHVNVVDYVANGSFSSLRKNVQYLSGLGYAILVRLVDFNSGWNGDYIYVSQTAYRFLKKSALEPGDVIISNVGANAGTVFRVPNLGKPMTLGPNSIAVKPASSSVISPYLYYYFTSPLGQHQVQSIISGSAQPKFNKTDFRNLTMPLPPLAEQHAIAHILGSLDDKIELNRQMNRTLEEMTRAIFKSWFVDFDPVYAKARGEQPVGMDTATAAHFPDSFEETELGPVPSEFAIRTFADVCQNIFSGGTPSTSEPEYWGGGIPWFSSGETRSKFIVATEKSITTSGAEESSTRFARAGTTVIAGAGQGYTRGQTSFLLLDTYINQSVVALEANTTIISDTFLFFDLERRYDEFRRISDGHSSRGSLTTKLLAGLKLVVPPPDLVRNFGRLVDPFVRQIDVQMRESQTLAELRDTLLPKLMSGELRVSEAAEMVELLQ